MLWWLKARKQTTPLERQRQKRQEALQRRGVLIPPSFGVVTTNSNSVTPLSSSSSSSSLSWPPHPTPSLVTFLHRNDESYRLIHDYMQPGFWLATGDSGGGEGGGFRVRAAMIPPLSGKDEEQDSIFHGAGADFFPQRTV